MVRYKKMLINLMQIYGGKSIVNLPDDNQKNKNSHSLICMRFNFSVLIYTFCNVKFGILYTTCSTHKWYKYCTITSRHYQTNTPGNTFFSQTNANLDTIISVAMFCMFCDVALKIMGFGFDAETRFILEKNIVSLQLCVYT